MSKRIDETVEQAEAAAPVVAERSMTEKYVVPALKGFAKGVLIGAAAGLILVGISKLGGTDA